MKRFLTTSLFLAVLALPALAGPETQDEDEVVRLPGSGEVKTEQARVQLKADRLKPGGGLLASFDEDNNRKISAEELDAGIRAAFTAADANGDDELTAIEQMDWADSLPTRDDSLANPVRFDPNLDRRVSFSEFRAVILDLARDYRKDEPELRLASLKAPKEEKRELINIFDGELGTRVGSTDF